MSELRESPVTKLQTINEITREEWVAAQSLIREIIVTEQCKAIAYHYGQWTAGLKLFRMVEEARMYRQCPTPLDLSFHKICITNLISTGEALRVLMDQHSSDDLANMGISSEDAKILVTALEDSYAEWHAAIPQGRLNELTQKIFGKNVTAKTNR